MISYFYMNSEYDRVVFYTDDGKVVVYPLSAYISSRMRFLLQSMDSALNSRRFLDYCDLQERVCELSRIDCDAYGFENWEKRYRDVILERDNADENSLRYHRYKMRAAELFTLYEYCFDGVFIDD